METLKIQCCTNCDGISKEPPNPQRVMIKTYDSYMRINREGLQLDVQYQTLL